MPRVVAVVPCRNEERTIRSVVHELASHVDAIVVVDDGSTDRTAEEALAAGTDKTVVLTNVINCGKGAAARTGCDYAVEELEAELLVLLDGDGQHEPADVPRFVEAGRGVDIVFGLRKRTNHMPPLMRLGNWGLSLLSNTLFRIVVEDTQCGFRLLTREAYRKVRWESSDYAMESEMIARAGLHGLRHREIRIKTVYLDPYKGTGVIDGIKIGWKLLKWRVLLW